MTRWQLEPILNNYWIITVLAISLLGLLLLVRPFNTLQRRRQTILTWLRGALIGLIVLAMLRPTIVRTETRDQRSTLIWLLDKSRSMLIPDAKGEQTRWEALRGAVENAEPELSKLGDKFDIEFYLFDEAAHLVERTDDELPWPVRPDGKQSDIGSSLYDVLLGQRGSRIAGVLLLSDGAQRALAPRVNLRQPASELALLDAPLYTVTFGQPRDRSQSRDVAVENVQDQYTIFVNNEFSLSANVRIDGFAGRKVPVMLEIELPDGGKESRGPIEVTPSSTEEPSPVQFTFTPPIVGQYKLTVRAEAQQGELVTANNQLTAFLSVMGGGLRVLYLYGNLAGQENKFLRRSIDASPEIQLDSRWVDARRRTQWPIDLSALIGDREYDVFILGDLDFTALGLQNCAQLAKDVQKGSGFLMTGGAHSFGPGGYQPSALSDVLPIRMGELERQSFGQDIREDVHVATELLMLPSETPHFITHLAGPEQNMGRWRELPPLLGANRFSGLKSRGAVVLAEAADKTPLLVEGQYGNGRVLAFAGDSTYRWFRHGKQAEHKRFWRQVILWLAKKEDTDDQDVWVRLDQRRYPQGSQVDFELGARNTDGDPILDANFEVVIADPDDHESKVVVSRDSVRSSNGSPDGDAQWRGHAGPFEQPGDYTVRVTATRNGSEIGSTERQFAIQATDLELVDPAANPSQLEMLANLTREAGGQSLAPEDLPELVRQIGENPPNAEIEYQSKWQITDTWLGAWGLFVTAIGLLSTEWFLRKRWGLV